MKKYINIICLFFFAFISASCIDIYIEKNASEEKIVQQESASLCINIDADEFSAETKSISGDPQNAADTWSTWEKFVDGALLYHVTIFVLDSDNKLAAYRDFFSGSDDIKPESEDQGGNGFYENSAVNASATTGVEVKATFLVNAPLHDGEQLQEGDYKVLAVANYSPITSSSDVYDGSNTYAGLGVADEDGTSVKNGDGGDFTALVNNIITAGIGYDFDEEDGQALINYTLNSGDDRVCKLMPQPLVMVRDVTLTNGETKTLTGKLSRTFARIRLTISNKDESAMVGISALTFTGAYASQKAYLFNDKSANAAKLSESHKDFALYSTAATLAVSSEDAIIPFDSSMKRLVAGTSYNIFDCYILEGMIEAEYAFQFTATHWTSGNAGSTTANYKIESWDGSGNDEYGLLDFMVYIRKTTSASDYYIMEAVPTTVNNVITGGYMKVSTTSVPESQENSSNPLSPQYVWEIQPTSTLLSSKVGTASGQLFSIGYSLYLQAYNGETDMVPRLGYSKSPTEIYFKINFDGADEKGTIFCQYDGYWYYIEKETGLWTKTSATTTSLSSISSYEKLLFGTIPGQSGSADNDDITCPIVMSSSGSTGNNEIVRNDFFWGTIPIKVN